MPVQRPGLDFRNALFKVLFVLSILDFYFILAIEIQNSRQCIELGFEIRKNW